MTESRWGELLAAVRGLQHRIMRLAGDAQALADEQAEARAGAAVDRWSREARRIGMELADGAMVVDRIIGPPSSGTVEQDTDVDEAADTNVIALADLADDE